MTRTQHKISNATSVFRIVTRGGTRAAYRRSSNYKKAEWLNQEVQSLIDAPQAGRWHDLIKGPFRYKLPVSSLLSKRFLPPNWHKNAFFAAYSPITSIYEIAYYFLRERVGRKISSLPQTRTLFSVNFSDPNLIDLSNRPDIGEVMNRYDYSRSHQIVREFPDASSFQYPSCRAPDQGACVVTYDISCLGKTPKTEQELAYAFDMESSSVDVVSSITALKGLPLQISWESVS